MSSTFEFKASDSEILRSTLYGAQNLGRGVFLVFVHGFKGFKDWGFWPFAGECFASHGHSALAFNFSHNGVGKSLTEFDELDRFARNTYSREIRELGEVIDAVKRGRFGETADSPIALISHSRGGAIALTAAHLSENVAGVVTWSSISRFDRYSEHQKMIWREKGYVEALNQRTGQIMRLDLDLLDDVETNRGDLLNLEMTARKLSAPLLIIHGDQDLTVPVTEALDLQRWSVRNSTHLRIIPNTGHTFGVVHPFAGCTEPFDDVLGRTLVFLDLLC